LPLNSNGTVVIADLLARPVGAAIDFRVTEIFWERNAPFRIPSSHAHSNDARGLPN
jgi:hypothetical protein